MDDSKQNDVKTLPKINGKIVKKRGRPAKSKYVGVNGNGDEVPSKQTKITDTMKKVKRTVDRFKGVTKEELMTRLLPDRIKTGLDVLIIGINPGLFAAYKGHHYAGPGNHFWKCINMSGFVDKQVSSDDDCELLNYGIGFSTIVQRTTPSAKDLSSKEIREGGLKLIEKIQQYQPKIAVFNGKGIYEIFSKELFGQKKKDFVFGRQPKKIPDTNTHIFVMPSSSARCAQFPRAQDKVHFYIQIKRLRDEINGVRSDNEIIETNYTFDLKQATEMAKLEKVKEEKHDPSYDKNEAGFPTSQTNNQLPQSNNTTMQTKQPQTSGQSAIHHPHLVKCLQQNDHTSMSDPKACLENKPLNALRVENVTDAQKSKRVDMWLKTQHGQEYDSGPPMGAYGNTESASGEQAESDQGSQRSLVSAGVSGSNSTGSTSGYGSADTAPQHNRQDRVERWVREQQYVQHQPPMHREMPDVAAPANHWIPNGFQVFGASPSSSMDGRPPVPLYSVWGGNEMMPGVNYLE